MTQTLDLDVERAVAGGRMLARHEGKVVLVAGAIPGERVRARVERSARGVIWAEVTDVITASPHRQPIDHDPTCGGLAYRHIAYDHQRQLKSEVIADAFRRVGKISLDEATPVVPSPGHGYRLRARLHVQDGRAGFFRAGTHVLCDAAMTGQLLPETLTAVEAMLAGLPAGTECEAVQVAENIAATERVLHLVARGGRWRPDLVIGSLPAGVTGVTTDIKGQVAALAGVPYVSDTAADLFGESSPVLADTRWVRHAPAFFQSNRFLTGALAQHVLSLTPTGEVVDLYAGVGLFTVALLARGVRVIAVEHDATSGGDLETNIRPWPATATVVRRTVEETLPGLAARALDAVILDPPRSGISTEALAAIAALHARRLIYVSCDPPTLARDTARLTAAGYVLGPLRAFDLFPHTAHIETVAVLDRPSGY